MREARTAMDEFLNLDEYGFVGYRGRHGKSSVT